MVQILLIKSPTYAKMKKEEEVLYCYLNWIRKITYKDTFPTFKKIV